MGALRGETSLVGRSRSIGLVLVTGLFVVNWIYFGLQFSRHWQAFRPQLHLWAIVFLAVYPIPYLHVYKKNPDPILLVGFTYGLLQAAGFIMFSVP